MSETWLQRFEGPLGEARLLERQRTLYSKRRLCKDSDKPVNGWQTAEAYRCILFDEGREVKEAQNQTVLERRVSGESAKAVLAERGKLSTSELVRQRVRCFSDGAIAGQQGDCGGYFRVTVGAVQPEAETSSQTHPKHGDTDLLAKAVAQTPVE